MIRPWGIVLLALLAVVSILLAVGSGIAWHKADNARASYLAQATAAQGFVDSLAAVRCVPVADGSSVRVFPAPRPDTLRRAGK